MNKCLLLIVISYMCVCVSTSAQTLHSIIFTDTQDESIGIAAKASHDYYSLDLLSTIETSIGTSYNSSTPIDKSGYECNRANLLQTLNDLSCSENDIVVFIYIGHGARGLKDLSNFPQMCFAVPLGARYRDEDDFYPLENVRDLIMKKNPRFCLVIGDCCNSYSPTLSTKPSITAAEAMSLDIIHRQGENVIRNLFLTQKGSVILTASIKGQYGWCLNGGPRKGMLLERNLNEVFQDIKDGKASYSNWEELLSSVKNNTYRFSQTINLIGKNDGRRYTQTPYYEIKLAKTSTIPGPKSSIEAKDLQQALKQVADSRSFSDTERLTKSRALQSKYFDGDKAMVEVVGKDKTTIIQSTDIHKYLLRIATERDLANITILEQRKDANKKVIYLKVHEIYVEPVK
ncbi:MAG: caspase family protein [Paludibacteraceae bacterium]|nr:caspase family protein [Paludibacteraceae bacterium]